MGKYLSNLRLDPLADGVNWRVINPFKYQHSDGRIFTAPAGMITDMTSTPRFIWRIIPPATGKQRKGAVIHDLLYRIQVTTRKEADEIYQDCMKLDGVPSWKRRIIHIGLRVGGWVTWKKNKLKLEAGAKELGK